MEADYVSLLLGGVFGCVITALVATAFRGSDTSKPFKGQIWDRGMPIGQWRKQVGKHHDSKHQFGFDDNTLRLALLHIHTELTELRGTTAEFGHQSPEFAEELADNVLLALDFTYRANIDIDSAMRYELDLGSTYYGERTIPRLVSECANWLPNIVTIEDLSIELHDQINYMVKEWRKTGVIYKKYIASFLCTCFSIANKCNTDLVGAMVKKMEFNETRPFLHGKKW